MNDTSRKRLAWAAIGLLVLALISILAYKAFRIYTIGQRTYTDLQRLQNLPRSNISDPTTARELGNSLASLQTDLDLARFELTPLFPITRTLTWLPRFSTEAVYAEQLFEAGNALLETGRSGLDAALPTLEMISDEKNRPLLDQIPAVLQAASAPLTTASEAFSRYQTALADIPMEMLDPLTQAAFSRLDELTPTLTNAFTVYPEIPALLGISTSQPTLTSFNTLLDNHSGATYLLIFQNEDELRATGGFVTAIGTLTIKNGKPSLGAFTDSPTQDDLSKIYPPPPWWLKQYMRSDYLLLRDANWEIDYPQAALSLAQLYRYYDPTPLSGVIAMDQQAIVSLLRFTGPIDVVGFDQPVSADNLIDQLRAAKTVDAANFGGVSGERKAFLAPIAAQLMGKLVSMADANHAKDLYLVFSRALDQKQILVSFFTPAARTFMNEQGWDGSVAASPAADTLMVVDSNIGFNKTNALITRGYTYTVNLSDPSAPSAELVVNHSHGGTSESPCQQWGADNPQPIAAYPMERCYYNYLRVVADEDSQLTASQTHAVSGLIIGGVIPAQVDELTDQISGARVWGTLMALPGQESMTNSFRFALPADVISPADDSVTAQVYHLRLFKQPGAHPEQVELIIKLPESAAITAFELPSGADLSVDGHVVAITFQLVQDELISVTFE